MNHHARRQRDAGSVSVLAAVLVPCLLLVFAILIDGADRLRVLVRADAIAAEAARAALTAVDTRGHTLSLDSHVATATAQRYLTATNHTGTVILDSTTVQVTVTYSEPARIGLLWPTHTVTGRATAALATGTQGPGGLP
ncbi:hypothetical protein SAMN05216215_1018135 [Saccharopolyspora shandongensis]|uniref:Flp pilus-assembly TadE/G-like n=1 Tax=Saccharopolyspora shandongensis TaxID=418495 RepID=A0A1H3GF53_9PSEU|nr:hypothetical protein [Saccharopolyspora shandongensis]SDY01278.1 hypothetical protein SAMN05216215_1018135 [Saccharopolyspora shandongensis]